MANNTPEFRTAKALMRGVADITFDPKAFAYVIIDDHPAIRARVMEACLTYIIELAGLMETNGLADADADAIVTARRIVDALDSYGA